MKTVTKDISWLKLQLIKDTKTHQSVSKKIFFLKGGYESAK